MKYIGFYSFKEDHLPKHMRMDFTQRCIRFLFVPISLMSICSMLNYDPIYREIEELCQQRNECFAHCDLDTFPRQDCHPQNIEIHYRGNEYEHFFLYPNNYDSDFFKTCHDYVTQPIPVSNEDSTRQLKVHTCFESCKRSGDCLSGFDIDGREVCATTFGAQPVGILCVNPELTKCENYVAENAICLDDDRLICIDWQLIILSVIIMNCFQVFFEASMLYAVEISLKPTVLEKL